jgi:hypothetical protein
MVIITLDNVPPQVVTLSYMVIIPYELVADLKAVRASWNTHTDEVPS